MRRSISDYLAPFPRYYYYYYIVHKVHIAFNKVQKSLYLTTYLAFTPPLPFLLSSPMTMMTNDLRKISVDVSGWPRYQMA